MAAFKLLRILTCLLMAIIIAASFANGQEALAPPPPSTESTDSSQALLGQTPQGTRRGILFNDPTFVRFFNVKDKSFATWHYNHESLSPNTSGWLKFVPMLRDLSQEATDVWIAQAKNIIKSDGDGPTWALSFHEPDNCSHGGGGSCILIEDAVQGWKTYMEPLKKLKQNMYIVSPSVTNVTPSKTAGLGWLKGFMDACKDCHVDVVAINWYGSAKDVQKFKDFIDNVRTLARDRPVWVTGLRPIGSFGETKDFLADVMTWMDKSKDIHRYAYVMARLGPGMLITDDGKGLSEMGKFYAFYNGTA